MPSGGAAPKPSAPEGPAGAGAAVEAARARVERVIGEAMVRDRRRLRGRLRRLAPGDGAGLDRLAADAGRSRGLARARAARLPAPSFPPELPVAAVRERIAHALERHQVVVVCGETGSGKTTQLPKICLAAGRGAAGLVGHTQPRRMAARSVAARISRELGLPPGEAVGSKVRFHDDVGPDAFVKVMTDGILIAEIAGDRRLEAYDTLIVDEAHERSLNIDLLLGHLRRILPERPELRVIVSSATLDAERIAGYFGGAPVIEAEGRAFPIEVRYADADAGGKREEGGAGAAGEGDGDPIAAVPGAVRALLREGPGDVLVFLPGERDIHETARALGRDPSFEVLPLYARLGYTRQERVLRRPAGARRRVVLATDVAETSVTVPGIRFVVDTGLARIARYSYRHRVRRLPVEPVSRASADQRKGRCGRVGPGVCVRLYPREDYERRPAFTEPEIRRTDLASVLLRMAAHGLGPPDEFPFLDPPDRRFVADARRLLHELGAFDAAGRMTPLGRRLARLPVDPRIARTILAAADFDCVAEMLVIAAALSVGDPRESPANERERAAAAHRRFADPRSDFMGLLNLWRFLQAEGWRKWNGGEWRRRCREHFLSLRRSREWLDVHRQLLAAARDLGLGAGSGPPAAYAPIHRALLAGHVANVGVRAEGREYRGPRERTFVLSPASAVKPSGRQWIVAAELVETSALYAHAAARIRPQWIERAARGLVTREYFDPRFDPERGEVMALERVALFGLTVVPRRRIRFAPVDPAGARAIFIAEGLVAGRLARDFPFAARNRAVLETVRGLEHKARRRDLLADEEARARFFDSRLPPGIASGRSFERWHDALEDPEERLGFSPADAVRAGARPPAAEDFPDAVDAAGVPLELAYRFAPGEPDDGITARVAATVLGGLDPGRFEWLVPGRLEEKAEALLRTLPRPLRRRIVPLADTARRCAARLGPPRAEGLCVALVETLRAETRVEAAPADLDPSRIPEHLRMRFEVRGADGRVLGDGRDLAELKDRFRTLAARSFGQAAERTFERSGLVGWCFEDLPARVDGVHSGVRFRGYPALEDHGDSVGLRLFDDPERAARVHRGGLLRLALLGLGRELRAARRTFGRGDRLALRYLAAPPAPWSGGAHAPAPEGGGGTGLEDELLTRALCECFPEDALGLRSREAFERRLEEARAGLVPALAALREAVERVFDAFDDFRRERSALADSAYPDSLADLDEQMAFLVYRGFAADTPLARIEALPRYLEAAGRRLEKLPRDPARDLRAVRAVRPPWTPVRDRLVRLRRAAGALPEPGEPAWMECRWMVEELRISLFAQEMGTRYPVSAQRVERAWAECATPAPGPGAPRSPRAPAADTDSGS